MHPGEPNAIAVLAASESGGLLHAPDLYMEKLVVGPSSKGAVSLDAPVEDHLRAVARCLDRDAKTRLRDFYLARIGLMKDPDQIAALRRNLVPVLTRMKEFQAALAQYIELLNRYPEDENLLGAVLEKVLPPDGSDRNPYHIRDLGTIFFIQAAAAFLSMGKET